MLKPYYIIDLYTTIGNGQKKRQARIKCDVWDGNAGLRMAIKQQSEYIKTLQEDNRKLKRQVFFLKNTVSRLMKKLSFK